MDRSVGVCRAHARRECASPLFGRRRGRPRVTSENSVPLTRDRSESEHDRRMIAIAFLFICVLCDCFKSRRRLEAEIPSRSIPYLVIIEPGP